jgi:flagellar hook assembly protein FlgD
VESTRAPINPSTTVRYEIPAGYERGIDVVIEVFNVRGQRVTTLVNAVKESGSYEVHWDGRDEAGQEVGSGVYIYRLKAGPCNSTRKMVIAR